MGKHVWNPSINLVMMYKVSLNLSLTRNAKQLTLMIGPQLVFVMEFVYSCTIPAIKMSVIMFYHRLFPVPRFTYLLYFCTFLALGWFVGVMVFNLIQCHPYSYFWEQYGDTGAQGSCLDVEAYFMGNGIAEAITDFIILCAPFHEVWKLHMPTPQKLAVIGIFGLGALYVFHFSTS